MHLVDKVIHRLAPLRRPSAMRGFITRSDYRQVSRTRRFAHGDTRLMEAPVRFSDAMGFLHSVDEIFCGKVYEFNAANDRPHIIDAGANIGLSVLYFKRRYPNATIVAYEPDDAIFQLLKANTAGLTSVDLHNTAAWTEDTQLTFYSEGSLAGSTELDYIGAGKEVTVRAERLKTEIARRPVDFLKIDIEGAENDVLFDIEDELAGVDHLFFEYHSNPRKPQRLGDMLNLVTRNGFRYVINGAHGPKHPFVERQMDGFDLQLNVSCYREAHG